MFKLGRTPENSAGTGEAAKPASAPLSSREQAEREAQTMLDQLRGQPGFGVVMTASEGAPRAPEGRTTLGQRLATEMEELARRERTLKEVRELSMRRVSAMTPEQIKRLLDFCS